MGAMFLAISICISASAAYGPGEDEPQASLYLSSYGVDLIAVGNGQMVVEMDVIGTGTMSKIGVYSLLIEQKVNGTWSEYATVFGIYHSDFYAYNTISYLGEYYFNGTAGVQYRVTMTAYARNSTGSDTGQVTSAAVTCHNP